MEYIISCTLGSSETDPQFYFLYCTWKIISKYLVSYKQSVTGWRLWNPNISEWIASMSFSSCVLFRKWLCPLKLEASVSSAIELCLWHLTFRYYKNWMRSLYKMSFSVSGTWLIRYSVNCSYYQESNYKVHCNIGSVWYFYGYVWAIFSWYILLSEHNLLNTYNLNNELLNYHCQF